ncbi:hypothetical protein BH11PLA1_BH11PLA1_19090 [soil metagenome]
MKSKLIAALVPFALAAAGASADTVVVDVSGWNSFGSYGNALNTSVNISVPVGAMITEISYGGVSYATLGFSYVNELTFSVNDGPVGAFWDGVLDGTNGSGSVSNANGLFSTLPGAQVGGGPFTSLTGSLFVTVYEQFDDAGATGQDAAVSAGLLTITYSVPTPGAAALLGLGGLVATRRRRA